MFDNYQFKVPKLTKPLAEECISLTLGVPIVHLNFVKLLESPKEWKHACVPTGVIVLVPRRLPFYNVTFIDFAVCPSCGKVVYHYDDTRY
jgi:hypothetical protein